MSYRRIRKILTALAVFGVVAATSASAYAIMCQGGWCSWW